MMVGMQRNIDTELDQVKQMIVAMGRAVEESVSLAIQALIDRDPALLDQISPLEKSSNTFWR